MTNSSKKFAHILALFAMALTFLFLSGCTKAGDDINDDIKNLQDRVTNLENLVSSLDAKIEAKLSILDVTSNADGHTILFSDGSQLTIDTPKIEVKSDGSLWINGKQVDGVKITGSIDVRDNDDGTTSIWCLVNGEWTDTGIGVDAVSSSNMLKAIAVNEVEGLVAFIMNNGQDTTYVFALTWAAITDIEIIPTRTIEFTDTEKSRRISFLVSPSTARVPTGSGTDIGRWSVNEVYHYTTRAMTRSDVFSIQSIEANGNGEYTATIVCDVFNHDQTIDEYVATLALNTNLGLNMSSGVIYYSETFGMRVTIPQDALLVSTESLFFIIDGNTSTVKVSSATDWTATTTAPWLSIEKNSDQSFSVTAMANNDSEERIGYITVDNGSKTKTIEVTQETLTLTFINMGIKNEYPSDSGTTDILVYFQNYIPTNSPQDFGWQLAMNISMPQVDRSGQYLDIKEGEYTIRSGGGPFVIDKDLSMVSPIEFGYMIDSYFLIDGTMTVRGDHNQYTIDFAMNTQSPNTGEIFSLTSRYVGPCLWENKDWANPDFRYEDFLGSYTATGKPSFYTDTPGASTWQGQIVATGSKNSYTVTNAFNIALDNSHPIEVNSSGSMFFNTRTPMGQTTQGDVMCIAAFKDDKGVVHFLDYRDTFKLEWDAVAGTIKFPVQKTISGGIGLRKIMYGIGVRGSTGAVDAILSDDLYEDLVLTVKPNPIVGGASVSVSANNTILTY